MGLIFIIPILLFIPLFLTSFFGMSLAKKLKKTNFNLPKTPSIIIAIILEIIAYYLSIIITTEHYLIGPLFMFLLIFIISYLFGILTKKINKKDYFIAPFLSGYLLFETIYACLSFGHPYSELSAKIIPNIICSLPIIICLVFVIKDDLIKKED